MNSIKNFFIFCCFNNKIQFNNHCRRFRQIRRRLSFTAGVRGEKSPVEFLPNRLSVAGGAFLSVHSLPFFRGNEFLAEQEVGHVSDFPGQRIFHPAAVFLDLAQEVGQLADGFQVFDRDAEFPAAETDGFVHQFQAVVAAQESVGLADFGRDFNQAVNRLLESSGVSFAAFKRSRDFMEHHFHLGEAFAVHQFGRFIKLFFNNEVAGDYLRSLLGNGTLGAQRLALGYAPNRGLPGGDNLFYRLNVGSGVGAERRQPML